MKETPNQKTKGVEVPKNQCDVVADDGTRCIRVNHLAEPNAHDFTNQTGIPVDGGRKWSEWIRMVHEVRNILLLVVNEEGSIKRESKIDDWHVNYCRAVIADVARAVGLEVEVNKALEPVRITEKEL